MAAVTAGPPVTIARRPRVLVVSPVAVGRELAGAAIRPFEIARAMQEHADVVLAVPPSADPPTGVALFAFAYQDPATLAPALDWADAVVAQPQKPLLTRMMVRAGARLIYDLYVPEPLELLEAHSGKPVPVRETAHALSLDRVSNALRTAHHVICATEAQRDLWLGIAFGQRLIGPGAYDRDPTLRSSIDVVPSGLPVDPPRAVPARGIRSALPAIASDDEVVLWNGGIWAWLDAPTAVEAIDRLRRRRPQARLVFMGRGGHEAAAAATARTEELARRLGLLGETVFFNPAWVPYGERASWLLEADVAISCHVEHLETRFAFRTRLLDCFWSGLPVVCTEGDELAARVRREDLGEAVPQRDPEAVAAALDRVLERGRAAYAGRFDAARAAYSWPHVVGPIADWLGRDAPPRLGARRVGARRPAHVARDIAYIGARSALNRIGLRRWPSGG